MLFPSRRDTPKPAQGGARRVKRALRNPGSRASQNAASPNGAVLKLIESPVGWSRADHRPRILELPIRLAIPGNVSGARLLFPSRRDTPKPAQGGARRVKRALRNPGSRASQNAASPNGAVLKLIESPVGWSRADHRPPSPELPIRLAIPGNVRIAPAPAPAHQRRIRSPANRRVAVGRLTGRGRAAPASGRLRRPRPARRPAACVSPPAHR